MENHSDVSKEAAINRRVVRQKGTQKPNLHIVLVTEHVANVSRSGGIDEVSNKSIHYFLATW